MLFYGTINCLHSHIMISNDNINEANEEVFVIELKLDYSLDPSSIILTRNASLGVIIDDDRKLNCSYNPFLSRETDIVMIFIYLLL